METPVHYLHRRHEFVSVAEKDIKIPVVFIIKESYDLELIHLFKGERFQLILTWALDGGFHSIHRGVQCGVDPSLEIEDRSKLCLLLY